MVQVPLSRDEKDSFEKKMASFLKVSEAKIADLNSKSSKSGAPRSGRRKPGGGRPRG